jgi:hypothetical protein
METAFFMARLRLRHFLFRRANVNLYRDLYYKLFAAIADAVEFLENNEPLAAKKTMIAVMREAEEITVSSEEDL